MSHRKTALILVAEDDPDDRLMIRDAHRESGAGGDLRFVEDGQALLDCLRPGPDGEPAASRPDLILLDLNMPRLDGREALREIKADPALRRIPVVVLTTSQEQEDISRAYGLGASSFIVKPVSFRALVDALRALSLYWLGTVRRSPPGQETGHA